MRSCSNEWSFNSILRYCLFAFFQLWLWNDSPMQESYQRISSAMHDCHRLRLTVAGIFLFEEATPHSPFKHHWNMIQMCWRKMRQFDSVQANQFKHYIILIKCTPIYVRVCNSPSDSHLLSIHTFLCFNEWSNTHIRISTCIHTLKRFKGIIHR